MKKLPLILLTVISLMVFAGCSSQTPSSGGNPPDVVDEGVSQSSPEEPILPAEIVIDAAGSSIILSTTTSTQDSGLLDYLLPIFTEETGIAVRTVAVGTGKALEMARNGEADVLLVHAKASEEELVAEGFGIERFDVMYNDFVIAGPADDPLGMKDMGTDVGAALAKIKSENAVFVSRGDDSGTHKKELEIWKAAEVEPEWENYLSVGQGMGDTLRITSEKQGYTITDRATYLSMRNNLDLSITMEGADSMLNQYGVICVNPEKFSNINAEGAAAFKDWMLSKPVQALIGEFGVEEFGQPLFVPNAK